MRDDEVSQAGGVAVAVAAGLAVLLAVVVVAFLLVGGTGDDVPLGTTDVAEGGVPPAVYLDVVLGVDPEALRERLLPARPVGAGVLDRYEDPPVGASCLHYRAAGRDDELYRFCFEDDRLVVKDVLSPEPE